MSNADSHVSAKMFGVILTLLLAATVVSAQSATTNTQPHDWAFDFENGLDGWAQIGAAFRMGPVPAADINTDRVAAVKIGGDYWRGLKYPLGQHGNYFISSDAGGQGELTSPQFVLDRPFFSFLIGGSPSATQRLELQILTQTANDAARLRQDIENSPELSVFNQLRSGSTDSQDYVVAVVATPEEGAEHSELELLQPKTISLPNFVLGRTARIKIIDNSDKAHINVDFIQLTRNAPAPFKAPVWGYADYHTHPMSHLVFGAARDINLLWGSPGTSFDLYRTHPELVSDDIPHCKKGHGGGPTAEVFINGSEKRAHLDGTLQTLWEYLTGRLTKHGRSGGPEFRDFPSFLSGAHQQMHITQIRRNYEGGLRLMVAIATHNKGAEYLASKVDPNNSIGPLMEDREAVEAVVCGVREQVAHNSEWMEIAYAPDDARRIIRHNKLAIVLGVEVDELGKFGTTTGSPKDEVSALWNLGIRVITPIHGIDNRMGGAALNFEVYSWLNDLLNRDKLNLTVPELQTVKAHFFKLREAGCNVPQADPREECVPFRFNETQKRVVIKKIPLLGKGPFPESVAEPSYVGLSGEKNAKGLESYGVEYIDELMDRGMIIDTAHMSDLSVRGVYQEIGARLQQQHPECAGFSFYNTVSSRCLQFAYPAIVSHAHFRAQARQTGNDFLASEYLISDRNVDAVHRVGGVIGPFVTEDPLIQRVPTSFSNDCAMSSKGFGLNFTYALQRMGGAGVGMATDFIFIPGVAPRFGRNACWAYHLAENPNRERASNSLQYDFKAQQNGVVYAGVKPDKHVRYGNNIPLQPYWMGNRKRPFDFNTEGLAHFGLVPDMLQDLKNLGMTTANFDALFSSSEGYIQMWERVWAASGCATKDCKPQLTNLNCDAICRGSCLKPPRKN